MNVEKRGLGRMTWFVVAVVAFVILGWSAVNNAAGIDVWLKERQHLSGWAQGVGGLLAVIAAFLVGNSQIRAGRALERERRSHEAESRIRTIRALVANATGVCLIVDEAWETRINLPLPQEELDPTLWLDCKAHLMRVDPFLIPHDALVIAVLSLPRQLQALHDHYNRFANSIATPLQIINADAFRTSLIATLITLEETRAACDAALADTRQKAGIPVSE